MKKFVYFFIFIIAISIIIFFISLFNNENKKLSVFFENTDITDNYIDIKKLSDEMPQFITIETDFGYNKFEVYKSKIACIESNCKNRVCVNTGFINKTFDNQIIVCVPHRVSVFYK